MDSLDVADWLKTWDSERNLPRIRTEATYIWCRRDTYEAYVNKSKDTMSDAQKRQSVQGENASDVARAPDIVWLIGKVQFAWQWESQMLLGSLMIIKQMSLDDVKI